MADIDNAKSVGYRNPPDHSRFQPGKSGNPKGRPKGTTNLATTLLKTLREKVIINENGKRKKITKLDASVKQLVNKAASGDLRALTYLIGITVSVEERAWTQMDPTDSLTELDQKVLRNLVKRYGQDAEGGDNCEKPNG